MSNLLFTSISSADISPLARFISCLAVLRASASIASQFSLPSFWSVSISHFQVPTTSTIFLIQFQLFASHSLNFINAQNASSHHCFLKSSVVIQDTFAISFNPAELLATATAIFVTAVLIAVEPLSVDRPSEVIVAESANNSVEPTHNICEVQDILFVKSRICHSVAAILLPSATTAEPILSIFPTPSPVTVPIFASIVAASSADIQSTATPSFATVFVNFPICSIGTQREPPIAAIEDSSSKVTGISLLICMSSCLNAASCSGVPSTVLLTQVKASSKDLAISEAFFIETPSHNIQAQVNQAVAVILLKDDTTEPATGLIQDSIQVIFHQVVQTQLKSLERAEKFSFQVLI